MYNQLWVMDHITHNFHLPDFVWEKAMRYLFNKGWKFLELNTDSTRDDAMAHKECFKDVQIPHDWLIYNTLDLYENSIGWYRRKLNYTKREHEQVLLHFDGVYMDSSVYVNGEFVGEWKYGYSAFEHDITEALKDGDNEILVKVVHQSPNSRWYSGAGIYRNVWLKLRDRSHILAGRGRMCLVDKNSKVSAFEHIISCYLFKGKRECLEGNNNDLPSVM